jgi:hypothetical protein
VEEVRESEDRIVIKVIVEVKKMSCPYCGSVNL